MYLAIDVGATKTLVAVFSADGKIVRAQRFPTAKKYKDFLADLKKLLEHQDFQHDYSYCCIALPGQIDHQNGVGEDFGNLAWKNVPAKADLQSMLPKAEVLVENDAKLAAVYEAAFLGDKYPTVLYFTISTGIGGGVVSNGRLDPALLDSEPGQMVLRRGDKLEKWEDFASGRALKARYGQKASEINDQKIWREYAADLAQGMAVTMAVIQPDIIVLGGGVGAHLEKFKDPLVDELKHYENDLIKIPPIIKAKRPEEVVAYGCYEYIKQKTI